MTAARALWLSPALMLAGLALIILWSAPRIDAGGLAPFDLRSRGRSLAGTRKYLAAAAREGRAVRLKPQRIADTIAPVGFAAVMMCLAFRGLKRLSHPTTRTALAPGAVLRVSPLAAGKSRLVDAAVARTAPALAARATPTHAPTHPRRRGWHT